ncbi:MAG: hypothetical protein NTX45_14825 [Proteobacteria bacterium]|nr:hypothetical protein [Pseudomonadota bacterium]
MNRSATKPNKSPSDHPKDTSLWWAITVVVAVAFTAVGSTVTTIAWLRSEVKTTMTSSEAVESLAKEIEKVRPQWKGKAVPAGAILIFGEKCPDTYTDISGSYDGRYILVDNSITATPKTIDADGSHEHNLGDGEHSHPVTGSTSALGKGEHMGSDGRDAPNHETVLSVSGTAGPTGSSHKHAGGVHEHKRVGVRLCRAPA